ncbi:MAG: hypothetical protein H0W30_19295 [Gemmatimonadaceae bacterium]|nr:hypothetical protein [Gemmatimonadaceae bacterium]
MNSFSIPRGFASNKNEDAFSRRLRAFLEANNLTNQPLRYFQGVRDRVIQEGFCNRRFTAGLKFDL